MQDGGTIDAWNFQIDVSAYVKPKGRSCFPKSLAIANYLQFRVPSNDIEHTVWLSDGDISMQLEALAIVNLHPLVFRPLEILASAAWPQTHIAHNTHYQALHFLFHPKAARRTYGYALNACFLLAKASRDTPMCVSRFFETSTYNKDIRDGGTPPPIFVSNLFVYQKLHSSGTV